MTYRSSRRRSRGAALTSVSLSNFKSAREATVPLAQLTLLVGENSSGKSSVLQALQLIRQAAISGAPGETFPLNGTMIRLGTIDELRTAGAGPREPVSIGVSLQVPDPDRNDIVHRGALPDANLVDMYVNPTIYSAEWSVDLIGTARDEPGSTRIRQLSFSVSLPDAAQEATLQLRHRAQQSDSDAEKRDSITAAVRLSRLGIRQRPPYVARQTVDHDFTGSLSSTDSRPKRVAGAVVRGGFPMAFVVRRKLGPILAHAWLEAAMQADNSRQPTLFPLERSDQAGVATEDELIALGTPIIRDLMETPLDDLRGYEAPVPRLSTVLAQRLMRRDAMSRVSRAIARSLPNDEKVLIPYEDPPVGLVRSVGVAAAELFREGVRYLGPLRAEPQVVMSTSPTARSGDIGSRGEFTAAVLRGSGNRSVLNPLPGGGYDHRTLLDAVTLWAHELGLVESLTPGDLGAIGLTMNVRPTGVSKDLPLPAVGVGVSQLLPVLVLCLLSERDDVILLEQPELHLHPAMQQRLADFLLAIAQSGRQLIIETHSEYIVSRLRKRIVQDETDSVLDLVNIVFAERSSETGDTTYRLINPSRLGGFEDWPAGFFDQAAAEEIEILRLAEQKRSRETLE